MGAQTYINPMMMNPYMQGYPAQLPMNYYQTPMQYYQPMPNYGYMDPGKPQYPNNNNMGYYSKGPGPKK